MSIGQRTRCQGNQYFQKAMQLRESNPAKSIPLFKSAIQSYQTAMQNIDPVTNDLASCSKNLGIACFRLGGVVQDLECTGKPLPSTLPSLTLLEQALSHISAGLLAGHRNKPEQWIIALQGQLEWLCDVLLQTIASKSRDERISFLRRHVSKWSPARLAQLWYSIAEAHFFKGVLLQQEGALDSAANEFQHAKQAAERGLECLPLPEARDDLRTLLDGIHVNCRTAEREKLIKMGNSKMRRALLEEEVLDVEALWDALDDFKESAMHASRDKFALHEAIASSKIGVIYFRCLKLTQRSRQYFRNAIQLAFSLQPVDVTQEEWFKEATRCEQEIQAATVQREAKEDHERRGKYMDMLKAEFDLLEEKKQLPFAEFLDFLVQHHAPPTPLPSGESSNKKRLLSAIRAYHPDKLSEGEDDASRRRYYLCEHICKLLNDIYCNADKGATLDAAADSEASEQPTTEPPPPPPPADGQQGMHV